MKAIETEYNGFKFRSRLEARWAVFFDYMGWEYEYEPEGFQLSSGLKYLPDFLLEVDLPNFETKKWFYVEVKPLNKEMTDYELNKIWEFATKEDLLLLEGAPNVNRFYKQVCLLEDCVDEVEFVFEEKKYGIFYTDSSFKEAFDEEYSPVTYHAIKKSREARFEFGESEKIKADVNTFNSRRKKINTELTLYEILSNSDVSYDDIEKKETFTILYLAEDTFIRSREIEDISETVLFFDTHLKEIYNKKKASSIIRKVQEESCRENGQAQHCDIMIIRVDLSDVGLEPSSFKSKIITDFLDFDNTVYIEDILDEKE